MPRILFDRATEFLNPHHRSDADPSALIALSAAGAGARLCYDRRVDGWVLQEHFLYNAVFADGQRVEVRVNAEFGAAASDWALDYAQAVGRVPSDLRAGLETITIQGGDEHFGGGNGDLLVHVGRGAVFSAMGALDEIILHEMAHISLDPAHAAHPDWLAAQAADGAYASEYAADYPLREDLAETLPLWVVLRDAPERMTVAERVTVETGLAHRVAYLDGLGLSLEQEDAGIARARLASDGADWLDLGETAQMVNGRGGDDVFVSGAGNDVIHGGGGVDSVVYGGAQAGYTLELTATGATVVDRSGVEGMDFLTSVEMIEFGDGQVDLAGIDALRGVSEADLHGFIELYIAYFNRAPDAEGLAFWGASFASGVSMAEMAQLFGAQDEARDMYPDSMAHAAFAQAVYTNVLGRVPDAEGFDFWVSVLDDGSVTRDQFILSVLEGAKAPAPMGASLGFMRQQAEDRAYLADKVDLGVAFGVIRGMNDVGDARAVMAAYDDGLDTAVAVLEAAYAEALDPVSGDFLMPMVGVLDDPFV